MDETNRFALMLDALTELIEEEGQTRPAEPVTAPLTLGEVIASAAPMPPEALFLGLAEDGLPVLLNLIDPVPGPLLLVGDRGSGKTALMQAIARAIDLMHSPSEVEFGVISDHTEDWHRFEESQNCAGICSSQEKGSQELVESLVDWAHNNKGESQSVVLFIENLETAVELLQEAERHIRWLLLRGPSRRVWPIVSLDATRADQMQPWLGFFRTRLFGCIQNSRDAGTVTGLPEAGLDQLSAGSQFAMRDGNQWLNFMIPAND